MRDFKEKVAELENKMLEKDTKIEELEKSAEKPSLVYTEDLSVSESEAIMQNNQLLQDLNKKLVNVLTYK